MKTQLTDQDALHIDAGIQEKYGLVAQGPAGHFTYPTGQEGLEKRGNLFWTSGAVLGLIC